MAVVCIVPPYREADVVCLASSDFHNALSSHASHTVKVKFVVTEKSKPCPKDHKHFLYVGEFHGRKLANAKKGHGGGKGSVLTAGGRGRGKRGRKSRC